MGGAEAGTGRGEEGHKPVLARLETRKTPAEPAAGAAAAEAAGAIASLVLPPVGRSLEVRRRDRSGLRLPRCSVAPGT